MAYEGTDPPAMTGRESPDSAHVSGKRALPRLFTNVRYREEGTLSRTSRLVKVFGCRQAYENRPCTNPRGCGDGLWGFEVLLG
jgi:hypothetical protein